MKDKLRPCPFCGGNDYHIEHRDLVPFNDVRDNAFKIVCDNCGASGPVVKREELLATWNAARRRKV